MGKNIELQQKQNLGCFVHCLYPGKIVHSMKWPCWGDLPAIKDVVKVPEGKWHLAYVKMHKGQEKETTTKKTPKIKPRDFQFASYTGHAILQRLFIRWVCSSWPLPRWRTLVWEGLSHIAQAVKLGAWGDSSWVKCSLHNQEDHKSSDLLYSNQSWARVAGHPST